MPGVDSRNKLNFLQLEDSELDAELIQDRLTSDGVSCEFRVARSREEFLTALDQGPWDLFICDYNVPGYDGASALAAAKDTYPEVPIIMVSNHLSEEEAVKCLHLGASDYLLKHSLARLSSAVERAIDQARAHTRERQAQQQFRSLMEHAPDAMVLVNQDGTILLVNAQTERLFGYGRDELIGNSVELLMPARSRTRHVKHMEKFYYSPSVRVMGTEVELFGRKSDGSEFPFEITLSPLETPNGLATNAVIRDLTERKNLESQLLRIKRMESIGSVAGRIAHDLNNALAPVLMCVELLRAKHLDSAELIDAIESGTKRGADMLRQLLVFSQGSFIEPKQVDTHVFVGDFIRSIKRSLPDSIIVKADISTDTRPILGDTTQLHQVLMNLCVNARDAMPVGGNITILVENIEITHPFISATLPVMPGAYVRFLISDNGSGMEAEVLERIFEPYFTTKGHGKGTGLGLSIVSGIVKSHRGYVDVKSEVGKGSTFTVVIPADTSPLEKHLELELQSIAKLGQGQKILVVDDSSEVLVAGRHVLSSMGFEVDTAHDGIEALALLEVPDCEIQIVITDLDMPGMDGYELVRQIESKYPKIIIIITSGVLGYEKVQMLEESGISAFLNKPFTQKMLHSCLSSVLK